MKPVELFTAHRKMYALAVEQIQPLCRKYGINQTCFDVLMFFANNPEYNTARDVCCVRGIKSGLASVAVETLIDKGYLSRQEDPRDRRIKRLAVTSAAAELIQEGRAVQHRVAEMVTAGIPKEELEAYWRVTERMMQNIQALKTGGTNLD